MSLPEPMLSETTLNRIGLEMRMSEDRIDSVARYTKQMAELSSGYDIKPDDFNEFLESVGEEHGFLADYQKDYLEESGFLVSVCDECGNHKLFDEKDKSYYCPVQHG